MISPKSPYPMRHRANVLHQKQDKEEGLENNSLPEDNVSEPVEEPEVAVETEEESVATEVEQPIVSRELPQEEIEHIEEDPTESLVEQAKEVVESVSESADDTPKTHYFYCQKPTGAYVTYKRNTQSKTYATEIEAFRKYLASQNIKVLSEEVK